MLIDVTRLADRLLRRRLPTGVDRVSLEYVRHFRGQSQALVRVAGRWVILDNKGSQRVFDALLNRDEYFSREIRWCVGRSYVLSWNGAGRSSLLLNTGHSGLDCGAYAGQVRRRRWKAIYFLHDLIPITHPEYCRSGEEKKHRRRVETMLCSSQGLIVNSSSTRATVEHFAARHGWPMPPCVVAPLAPARLQTPSLNRPLEDPYFVVLGTIEPRKNHRMLLQLWRRLVEEFGPLVPRLVVIGQRGWDCEEVVDLLEQCPALRGLVVELSRCSDAELSTWLHHSRALLFPSFTEGYGIPLVEALSYGTPVIASDLPVFREIAQDIPDYIDPKDEEGWKRLIIDYAQPKSAARSAQCRRMEGFRAPTWGEHFSLVGDFVREVYATH